MINRLPDSFKCLPDETYRRVVSQGRSYLVKILSIIFSQQLLSYISLGFSPRDMTRMPCSSSWIRISLVKRTALSVFLVFLRYPIHQCCWPRCCQALITARSMCYTRLSCYTPSTVYVYSVVILTPSFAERREEIYKRIQLFHDER